jgi:hypothetical protein
MRRDLQVDTLSEEVWQGIPWSHAATELLSQRSLNLLLEPAKNHWRRLVCNGCCQNIIPACGGEFDANREGILPSKQTLVSGKLTVHLTGLASSWTQLQESKPKKVSVGRLRIQIWKVEKRISPTYHRTIACIIAGIWYHNVSLL